MNHDSDFDIMIEIPDPLLIQIKGEGPRFIQKMPPTIQRMGVFVDVMLIVYINEPQNAHIKKYLADLESKAESEGFEMVRSQDFAVRRFIYTFEKLTSNPTKESVK